MANVPKKTCRAILNETLLYLQKRFEGLDPDTVKTVGFDLSLTGTGIVRMVGSDVVCTREVTTSTDDGTNRQRLRMIKEAITEELREHNPDFVSLEAVTVFTQNPMSAKRITLVLGQLLAAVEEVCPDATMIGFTTTQIKKIGIGHGQGDKNQILKEVFKRYGQDFDSDNVADAFCSGIGANFLLQVVKAYEPDEEDPKFMLKYTKGRDPKTAAFLEENNIPLDIFDVMLSTSGLTGRFAMLQNNDYAAYEKIRQKVWPNVKPKTR